MRRHILTTGLVIVGLAACGENLSVDLVEIPDGYTVYRMDPTKLNYFFVDSTHAPWEQLEWLNQLAYAGVNCLGLSPRTAPDTTGEFVFRTVGANEGRLRRRVGTALDSTVDTLNGRFLHADMGTRGAYAVTSTGGLVLTWSGGVQGRYFASNAVIRLSNDLDTIASDMSQKTNGDSIAFEWHVRWLRDTSC